MNYKYDLAELRTHAGVLDSQATAVKGASEKVSGTGAGNKEMYGILVGQIAHPLLEMATTSGGDVLAGLSELVASVQEGMNSTVAAYEATEQDHIDRTHDIVADLEQIVP